MEKNTSVVIPYYNNTDYIEKAIQSVLEQTVPAREILIVNDGSTAESRAFLEQFSPVAILIDHPENRGIAHARNTGVEHASGDYVAFLDADDMWCPEKLELQETLMKNNDSLSACHCGTAIFKDEFVAIEQCIDKPIHLTLEDCLIDSHVVPSSFLIKREAFLQSGGFDPAVRAEDYDFFLTLISNGNSIQFIPGPLVWFRRAGHGNESAKWQYIFFGRMQVLKKHWRTINRAGGYLALLRHLQRTFQLSRWRSPKPLSYLFAFLSIILPEIPEGTEHKS
ncbi:glycosyltransferase family 2 protein [Motiliproteus sp. MSK22-1]|uniref:glycosyltransferase family 2 protein n=1 Tax=Motiliproteus sp. MSK22-1 TaxID=1897630 RepID=UPI000976EBDA|nr:glycosyltransferase family 2 protein [Motiliproteus sp. MSK22-1]OMH25670.1 hypothetical protein BGP75_24310 [Motiliproteus sp. MSK22-1]